MQKIILLITFIFVQPVAYSKNHDKSFEKWKKDFASRVAKKKILSKNFVLKALEDLKYDPEIIEKDRNQITASTTVDYTEWIPKWINSEPHRIEEGKRLLKKYKTLLSKVERKYKVDKEVIISLWGVETLYGKVTGDYNLVHALSTLAYDKRRRSFFEKELTSALQMIAQGHTTQEDLKGSWAGATGNCQFMPSSFILHAQDWDKDGKKDIWGNKGDIFASIANYLKNNGWKKGKIIGKLAKDTKGKKFNLDRMRYPSQYHKLGLRNMDGSRLKGRWRRRGSRDSLQKLALYFKRI
jgi:membrane-bound lytic murein transglycosylase B